MKNSYLALAAQPVGNGTPPPPGRACLGGNRSNYESRNESGISLTPRELDVLALLCAGLSNKLISRTLGISGSTVKTHVAAILRELGVMSRVQAVVCAYRYRLLDDKDSGTTAAVAEDEAELVSSA